MEYARGYLKAGEDRDEVVIESKSKHNNIITKPSLTTTNTSNSINNITSNNNSNTKNNNIKKLKRKFGLAQHTNTDI